MHVSGGKNAGRHAASAKGLSKEVCLWYVGTLQEAGWLEQNR